MKSEKLKGNLDMLLLAVLAGGPGHGYSIITRLRERSGGAFDLPEGTVYPALHRLETARLLDSSWEVVAGRRRRLYRLTPAGQESLASEAQEWRAFTGSIAMVLGR
jgi:PadR family transcriptional regulator, regulatory protein PadR